MADGAPFLDPLFAGYSYLTVAYGAQVQFSKYLNLSSNFTATYNTATNSIDIAISSTAAISASGLELGYFRIYESAGDTAMLATASMGIAATDTLQFAATNGVDIAGGGGSAMAIRGGNVELQVNLGLGASPSYGTGTGVFAIQNASVAPSSNPSGGAVMYAQSGALKARGSGGTVTTFAPAEPHCPHCGNDYVLEWTNEAKNHHLAICFTCLASALAAQGIDAADYAFEYRVENPR